eukprot:GHRQ01036902.1.p1 GENE.GHRQ01036902.1~~GHRQ01036902.1.p1  ORF type:complete len:113 (-),score=9.12 GHRQ01036902.1:84-422(-)
MVCSAITAAIYKKYVLVSLIHTGAARPPAARSRLRSGSCAVAVRVMRAGWRAVALTVTIALSVFLSASVLNEFILQQRTEGGIVNGMRYRHACSISMQLQARTAARRACCCT